MPFLIDWGRTPQPSDTIRAQAELTVLRIEVPEPELTDHHAGSEQGVKPAFDARDLETARARYRC